jgi:hypothetical protein
MTNRIVAWVLAGALTYAWFWLGFMWSYLNQDGAAWGMPYVLATIIAVMLLTRAPRSAGTGMFDGIMNGIKQAPMLIVALAVMLIVAVMIHMLAFTGFAVDGILQAIAVAVAVGVTTSLWFGALERA